MCDARELNPANEEERCLLCGRAVCAGNEGSTGAVIIDIDNLDFKKARKEDIKGVEVRTSLR